jgi:hypothetical protein
MLTVATSNNTIEVLRIVVAVTKINKSEYRSGCKTAAAYLLC